MDAFVVRKRRRDTSESDVATDQDSTDLKLAMLASLHPDVDASALMEALLAAEGSVEEAGNLLKDQNKLSKFGSKRKFKSTALGQQASLSTFSVTSDSQPRKQSLTKRGKTLHLYDPKDVEEHTPCSIIHNFLPPKEADALLRELLAEAPSFDRLKFKLFDRVVQSPHTAR
jgi:hypothetical protein